MGTKKIILASASPRRAEILRLANIDFEVRVSNIEEVVNPKLSPVEIAKDLAEQKAKAVHNQTDGSTTIGSDTIVVHEDEIFGKPIDEEMAKEMLRRLSGDMHRVITGVAICQGEQTNTFAEITEVYFKNLSEEEIRFYVENYKPFDKAGSYAIQEYIGAIGIEKIEGDYYNVVGLPVVRLVKALSEL